MRSGSGNVRMMLSSGVTGCEGLALFSARRVSPVVVQNETSAHESKTIKRWDCRSCHGLKDWLMTHWASFWASALSTLTAVKSQWSETKSMPGSGTSFYLFIYFFSLQKKKKSCQRLMSYASTSGVKSLERDSSLMSPIIVGVFGIGL